MKKNAWIMIGVLVLGLLAFGCYSGYLGMDILGGTQVQVTIDQGLLDDAEASGIEYVDLRFYVTTDTGDELADTQRLQMTGSQSFTVSGVAGRGALTIVGVLPDGDTSELREPADSHVQEGDTIRVYFPGSQTGYWTLG